MMRAVRVGRLACLSSAALLGCSTARPPLTPPSPSEPSWHEFTSQHFVLETDVDVSKARIVLPELETLNAALDQVMPHPHPPGVGRTEVVLFAQSQDYTALGGVAPSSNGYALQDEKSDLGSRRVIVARGDRLSDDVYVTLLHEITHVAAHLRFPFVPTWLDEGLAEHFSTLRSGDDRVFSRGSLPGKAFWPESRWVVTPLQLLIPVTAAPTVRALLDADYAKFHALEKKAPQTTDDRRIALSNYAGARKLVEVLENDDKGDIHARFEQFLTALEEGRDARKTFDALFPDLSVIESAYREHLTTRFPPRNFPFEAPPVPTPKERAMTESELHVLWGRLLPWGSPSAAAQFDAAVASDPSSPEARFREAVYALGHGRIGESRRDFAFAHDARPDEPRYLLGVIIGRLGAMKKGYPPDAELDALFEEVKAHATTATELDAIAGHEANRGRTESALAFAERALAADPTCLRCAENVAVLDARLGRVPQGIAACRRAMALMGEDRSEGASFKKLHALLEELEGKTKTEGSPE